ncbi:hypothetical protein HK102_009752 [Quaeritorhiza haematococci]|nr:hypothetical protein HK102_009752 [Quaeritorhiza haematococci]
MNGKGDGPSREGAEVQAGVGRAVSGGDFKSAGGQILPILLDVADPRSIELAQQQVMGHLNRLRQPLAGVINNAGVFNITPMELATAEDIHSAFDVNLLGAVAVTRAFLPFLKQSKGRIINIGSIGGQMALPGTALYSASKSALAMMTECWRMELKHFGVGCSLIEPGSIKTPGHDKLSSALSTLADDATVIGASSSGTVRHAPPNATPNREPYDPLFNKLRTQFRFANMFAMPTDHVVHAVRHALMSYWPKPRYLVGWDARAVDLMDRFVPKRVVEWGVGWAFG